MSQYSIVTDATATAQTSLGSAIEENYKHQRSLESQINRLTASAQELAIALGETGVKGAMGGVLGILTQYTKGITELISNHNSLTVSMGFLSLAIILLEREYKKLIVEKATAKNISVSEIATNEMLTLSFSTLRASIVSVGIALKGMFLTAITNPLTWIMLAIAAVPMIAGHIKKLREEQEMLNQRFKEASDRIAEIKSNIYAGVGDKQDIFDLQANITKLDTMKQKIKDLQQTMGENFNPKNLSLENRDYLSFLGIDITKAKTATELLVLIDQKTKDLNSTLSQGKNISLEYTEQLLKSYTSLDSQLKDTNLSTEERSSLVNLLKNKENELISIIGKELVQKVKEKGLTEDVSNAIKGYINKKAEQANATALSEINSTEIVVTQTKQRIDEYNKEIDKIQKLIEARRVGETTQMPGEKTSWWQKYAEGIASGLGMDIKTGKNIVTEAIISESEQGKQLKELNEQLSVDQKAYDDAIKKLEGLKASNDLYDNKNNVGTVFGEDPNGAGSKSAKSTLDTWESVYAKLRQDYQNTAAILSRKIDLGIVKGLDVLDEKLKLEEDKLNNIFNARTQLTEDLATWKQKLSDLDTSEHDEDYLRQRKNILAIIKQITTELQTQNQKEEYQVKVVNGLKKEYEGIKTMMSKYNSLAESAINNVSDIGKSLSDLVDKTRYSLDLNKFFGKDMFGNVVDMFSSLEDSLKESVLSSKMSAYNIQDMILAGKAFIDVNQKIVDIFKNEGLKNLSSEERKRFDSLSSAIYDVKKQMEGLDKSLIDSNNRFNQMTGYLQELIDYENKLAEQKQKIKDTISSYQEELNALEEQEKVEDRQKEIEDAKLAIQEKQVALQEKLNDLKKIENEIDKVKLDKRFEFITAQGQRILTYDTKKVSELEEDKTDAQKDVDDASQDVLDAKQALKDKELEIEKEKQKELLQLQIDAAQTKLDEFDKEHAQEMEQFIENWIAKHQADLNYFNDIINVFAKGYNAELELYKSYWKEQQDMYAKSIKDAYNAGKRISAAFAAGKAGNSMPSTSLGSITYNPLTATTLNVPMASTTNITNNITNNVNLTQREQEVLMQIINNHASLSLASNS